MDYTPDNRASDADREHVVDALQAAFAEGRLTWGELDDRLRAATAARTWQQLTQLTADLPAPAPVAADPPNPTAAIDPCLICLLICLCPPAGIALVLYNRRQARSRRNR